MYLKKIKAEKNFNLRGLTTLKIGGRAKYFFSVATTSDLLYLLDNLKGPFYILGKGSNLLITDKVIKRPVIKLVGDFSKIRVEKERLEVGSSTSLAFLVKYCIDSNLSGIEGLAGMPATVGGMLATGASSFGSSIFDYLDEVEVIDSGGRVQRVKKDDIEYGYRYSSLGSKLILRAYFKFAKKDNSVKANVCYSVKRRIASQDLFLPSCGSVFKNPYPDIAGKLIEESGLKGYKKGAAKISCKHANFILNLGGGTYQQVDYLIKLIKDKVYSGRGILLEEEVQRWI